MAQQIAHNGIGKARTKSTSSVDSQRLIKSSSRRSSFLSESMLKETVTMHQTGSVFDGDGMFVLRVSESQGWRWNQYMFEMDEEAIEY